MPTYDEFLRAKFALAPQTGIPCDPDDVHPILKPHQRESVVWAVQGGRRALFHAFGLGKTLQQLEICRLLHASEGGKYLITCPLGVRQEFQRDSQMLGMTWQFLRRAEEMTPGQNFYLTNYESVRDGKLDPALFTGVSLDEASVLRSYGSKTYQEFLTLFPTVRFRFVATATPAPNRFKELIHYASFLSVMDSGEALTRFFQRDSTQANNLTLYPHQEKTFWLWLASWALFLQKPSDLGHDDTGYELPPLTVQYHEVPTNHALAGCERDGQGLLFKHAAASLVHAAREKRESQQARLDCLMAILLTQPQEEQAIIWCTLNDEQKAIEKALKAHHITVSSLYGSQDIDSRERLLEAWKQRRTRVFLSKPTMYGSGINMQQCHTMLFAGIDYKAQDFFQAIHRIHRFLQTSPCAVHIIHSEAERDILRTLQHKWSQHTSMVDNMSTLIAQHGLASTNIYALLARSIGVERIAVESESFTLVNNDAVLEAKLQPDASVGMVLTSIPFANHYEYTPSVNDFGHTTTNDHFWTQMDYLTPELLRILQPGRIYACHVKDRINFGNVTGKGLPTVSPFHCEAIMHNIRHGFDYLGMITVVTDVVRENNQTYRLGWTENSKDSTKMGVGSPEYILLFHKPQSDRSRGYADVPVAKSKETYSRSRWQVDAHAFWRSSGNRLMTAEEMAQYEPATLASFFTTYSLHHVYDYAHHIKIGEIMDARGSLPATFMTLAPGSWQDTCWTDINRMLTLNTQQAAKRAMLHVCPLQTQVIDRLIERYTNKDEVVYDPFMGIGSVGQRAVLLGRKAYGTELNHQYFLDSVAYCKAAEEEMVMPLLFDLERIAGRDYTGALA